VPDVNVTRNSAYLIKGDRDYNFGQKADAETLLVSTLANQV